MSIFETLDRMISRTVDLTQGEAFRLSPQAKPADQNGRRFADPERPVVTGIGVYSEGEQPATLELGNRRGSSNDLRSLVNGQGITLSIEWSRFADLGASPRQGDIVEMLDRAGQPSFRVVSAEHDGQSRMVLILARQG